MFCSVESQARESYREKVNDIGSNSILGIRFFGIQVSETRKVALGHLIHISP
jgi:hypothetical protein